jgi:CBS domain-containing protein
VRDIMRRDPISVSETEDLALALQIMLWHEIRHLPVVRDGRVVGLLSERDVLAHRYPEEGGRALTGKVGDAMKHPVETIHPGAFVADAAARMSVQKIGALPVVDAGALVGMITTTDVLGASAWLEVEVTLSADDSIGAFMTSKVVAARPEQPLADAVATMIQNGVRHLPVVDGMKRVVGMLSERDVRTALGNPFDVLIGESPEPRANRLVALKVSDAMTKDPRTIRTDAPMNEALHAFVTERFGALPVVDEDDHLVGIVSYLDLLPRPPLSDRRSEATTPRHA